MTTKWQVESKGKQWDRNGTVVADYATAATEVDKIGDAVVECVGDAMRTVLDPVPMVLRRVREYPGIIRKIVNDHEDGCQWEQRNGTDQAVDGPGKH